MRRRRQAIAIQWWPRLSACKWGCNILGAKEILPIPCYRWHMGSFHLATFGSLTWPRWRLLAQPAWVGVPSCTGYTPFGNSMRSLALLQLVGGTDFWKSVRAASSWCFGRHGLEHWYFYLRSCRFGISLMCQFHWELDCVGFPLLKFGDVVALKWWGGLVARGSFFPL